MSTKHSRKRDAVELAICSSTEHPSAEHVYTSLREDYPSISLGTVYRNIAQLRSDGKIKSVGVVDGIERYDGDLSDHPHFVCEECGSVIDIEPEDAVGECADEHISRKYNVEVTSRHIVYYGSCGGCK
ncbi:MAG: transcriptional repressor [Clostridiales bacterium]|nr:transcriptional repressor [Clostridiales bacterium]